MNFAEWNQGQLLSVVLVVVGSMLLVGASSLRERLIALGTLSQAIVLAFVVNGAFHVRSDLLLAALALACLFVLWSLLVMNGQREEAATRASGFVADAPTQREALPASPSFPPGDAPHKEERR